MASTYRRLVMQGRRAVGWLNFLAAAAISAKFTIGLWVEDAEPAYIALSFAPAIVATGLAVIIGPWLWVKLAAGGGGISAARGALAGLLTVLVVHLVTIEAFLIAGYTMMKITGESRMYLDEMAGLVLSAPVLSVYRLGWLTLPAGIAIGWGVALWCQRRMA